MMRHLVFGIGWKWSEGRAGGITPISHSRLGGLGYSSASKGDCLGVGGIMGGLLLKPN